ncbi:DUF2905 domain-containing protein [Mycolicibacterium thermoresistibile]|jgi:uncharacterized protein HemY|uniref:DUF2905 domain-containing protein n=2 Tax=Mycolicibacterium thermoresistibile TaxID=1797 RepID=G7CD42_MYCT3|nr:DUF2905 domain-containing protein [Mycolicibacterium thermoresistibile]EHI14102.1 hypothetical protein KEK_04452 [Mycolicibacterium thermoresistibile ATCC 19527]MCV7186833.1 DUF2905 domain-containing protein [Mycolicibacterium thermoresistibile]GAT17336.1 putative uncharacterized protein [Mycolicibacterium thermoresistibile]SNW17899.1 Protein of uncharacterised function (DUF2905) [Mycolicibacterium thermoresistibile]
MTRDWGPWLVGGGVLLIVVGLLAWSGALGWLGNLPGDIRIRTDNVRVYVPITSMLLISLLLSAVLWVVSALFRR